MAIADLDAIYARTSQPKRCSVSGECAKAEGDHVGRKPTLTPHQQTEARKRREARSETIGAIARSYNASRSTIQRL